MKNLTIIFLFTFIMTTFTSCLDDNIPRDRPVLQLKNSDVTDETEDETVETEETEEVDTRPEGAIIIQTGHCVCEGNQQVSIGNCESFCSTKTGEIGAKTLYFDVELTEAITLDVFEDLAGFCSPQSTDVAGKKCVIEAKDENGNSATTDLVVSPGQTSFEVNITGMNLREDETYRLSISEVDTEAKSTSVQLRLVSELIIDDVGGPLALMPVNQYTCVFRSGGLDTNTGELFNDSISQFHFYFIAKTRPEPLKEITLPTVACYDFPTFGTSPINSPLLQEQTGSFTVWNRMDPRFFSLDGNNRMKIDELIEQSLILQGQNVTEGPSLFFELQWMSGIDDGEDNPGDDGNTVSLTTKSDVLGMYMTPFLDRENGYRAYCPTQLHYYSDNPLFKALRDVVGIDTEGLYAAKQDNACDFLLVRETEVKQLWFYIENGQHIQPTDDTIRDKKIQFYWPADPTSPYIKKSHQRVYTIKGSEDISCGDTPDVQSGSSDSGGVLTNLPPHDNRIGCVPKLMN